MISPRATLALGTVLAAVGIWWLLPGSRAVRRSLGAVLAVVGFGCLASQAPAVGDWFSKGMFYVMAAGTVVGAVATISFRSPVYCAIWFGMALAGTAGLFLLAGAEFLAVATIVVYAGAILVTFLFVLMLAQPEGHASYDRRSWEAMLSAFTGAVLVGILTAMIGSAVTNAEKVLLPRAALGNAGHPLAGRGVPNERNATGGVPYRRPAGTGDRSAPPTISRLGAVLFTRYLVAVEAAGALLFAALVGAAVIVAQGRAAMKSTVGGREEGASHAS